MSGYAYDYSLRPERSGWRSVLTGFLAIVAVVVVSTISGALVTLELIAPQPQRAAQGGTRVTTAASTVADADVANAMRTDATVAASVSQQTIKQQTIKPQTIQTPAPQTPAPQMLSATSLRGNASTDAVASVQSQVQSRAQAPAQMTAQSTATIVPNVAPARAVPANTFASAQTDVADSELTFAKGYARRHAAAKASGPLADIGVAAGAFGRTAVKVAKAKPKPQAVASQDPRDPRRPDASWSANRFDFDQHQALAFGDAARQRRPSGPFGGFFGGGRLF